MPSLRPLYLIAALAVAACGGAAERDDAVGDANEAEARARSLGVAEPCSDASQCSVLVFFPPEGCVLTTYQPYSLVSPTAAAASAAAADQNLAALRARALTPPPTGGCTGVIYLPPVLTCSAGRCQAR